MVCTSLIFLFEGYATQSASELFRKLCKCNGIYYPPDVAFHKQIKQIIDFKGKSVWMRVYTAKNKLFWIRD